MGIFSRRRPTEALVASSNITAAAERVVFENAKDFPRLLQPWQQDAFKFYYQVGEIHYAAQFYAKGLAPLRLYVGRMDDQGEVKEAEASSEEAGLLDRVQDKGGGRSRLMGNYGRLKFLTGEGLLTVTGADEEDEAWEFLSGNEMKVLSENRYLRYFAPGIEPVEYATVKSDEDISEGKARVYRMWTPDPQFSYFADSPMRAVLDLCDELLLLTLSVRARTKSRVANAGILMLAKELDFGSPNQLNTEDSNQSLFQQRLQDAMRTAIQQPGSAAQVVPIVVPVPGNMIGENAENQAMRLLKIGDPNETYPETGLREELIKRIALGLDLPPEMLVGLSDTNHWNAFQIDEQAWKAHIEPIAQEMCDDLTGVYLRPAAKAAGISDWEDLIVAYDAAKAVNHPDRFSDFRELYDRGAIGWRALREAGGANDNDKPTPEEHVEWLAIKLSDPLLVGGEPEAQPQGLPLAQDVMALNPGKPDEDEAIEDSDTVNVNVASIMGAAEVAFLRCREIAGSRVRSKMRDSHATEVKPHDNHVLASALGLELLLEAGLPDASELVATGARSFPPVAVRYGLGLDQAEKIQGLIEGYAARTLYQENPGSLPARMSETIERLLR